MYILLFRRPTANNVQTKLRVAGAPCAGGWVIPAAGVEAASKIVESASAVVWIDVGRADAETVVLAAWDELHDDAERPRAGTPARRRVLAATASVVVALSEEAGVRLPAPDGPLAALIEGTFIEGTFLTAEPCDGPSVVAMADLDALL